MKIAIMTGLFAKRDMYINAAHRKAQWVYRIDLTEDSLSKMARLRHDLKKIDKFTKKQASAGFDWLINI